MEIGDRKCDICRKTIKADEDRKLVLNRRSGLKHIHRECWAKHGWDET